MAGQKDYLYAEEETKKKKKGVTRQDAHPHLVLRKTRDKIRKRYTAVLPSREGKPHWLLLSAFRRLTSMMRARELRDREDTNVTMVDGRHSYS